MMRRRGGPAALIALLLIIGTVPDAPASEEREGFALVLGGGGAKGLAHIGVIRVLEELEMTPSLVVGTSMGALVGSLYASGLDADRLESLVVDRNWLRTLLDSDGPPQPVQGGWSSLPRAQLRLWLDTWPPSLPPGASRGHAVEGLIGRLTADAAYRAGNDLDRLPIPFRCVSTDLMTGEAVVFDEGSVARMVRASGGLPLVFAPVEYRGRHLVDGGFVDNLPLGVARSMGFERAIVVDVSNAFVPPESAPNDLFGLLRRSTSLAQLAENTVDAGPGDVVLHLDLRDYTSMSFWGAEDIVAEGYRQASARRDDLRAVGEASGPAAFRPRPPGTEVGPLHVEAVDVRGNRRLSGWSIRKRFGLAPGDTVQAEQLWTRASDLARQSIFESVWVEAIPRPDGAMRAVAHVDERDRPELELAVNYRDDIGPAALLRLRLDNRLGAGGGRTLGWKVSGERASLTLDTSVPIRGSRRVEFRAGGQWVNERVEIEDGPRGEDAWSFRRTGGHADVIVGREVGEPALRFGFEAFDGRRHLESRAPVGDGVLRWRAVRARLETWTGGGLNTWPGRGFSVTGRWGVESFGGRSNAWSVEGGWTHRLFATRYFGASSAGGGAWSSTDLPVQLLPRAGGPRGWVGQDPDEILAPRLLWSRLGLDLFLNREVRFELAGAMGWYGRESLDENRPRPGIQLQVIWESALGPVQLGWAGGRGSEPRIVFDVGHEF
jgi:predicted acylesterase/phospholipase RssA